MNSSLQTHDTLQTTRARTPLEEAQRHFDRAALALVLESAMSQFLHSPMREQDAFRDLHDRADREQLSLRDAAHFIAVDRVTQTCPERRWV